MLTVNVGLTRKISENFNSSGYSINLEGVICHSVDDPEGVLERVQELYDLAEEALLHRVEIAEGRIEQAPSGGGIQPPTNPAVSSNEGGPKQQGAIAKRRLSGGENRATEKQLQFLRGLAKRFGLSESGLERKISQMIGRETQLSDLSKREAGRVLDELTTQPATPR